jgi:hypothetical protein
MTPKRLAPSTKSIKRCGVVKITYFNIFENVYFSERFSNSARNIKIESNKPKAAKMSNEK